MHQWVLVLSVSQKTFVSLKCNFFVLNPSVLYLFRPLPAPNLVYPTQPVKRTAFQGNRKRFVLRLYISSSYTLNMFHPWLHHRLDVHVVLLMWVTNGVWLNSNVCKVKNVFRNSCMYINNGKQHNVFNKYIYSSMTCTCFHITFIYRLWYISSQDHYYSTKVYLLYSLLVCTFRLHICAPIW